jgi:predicted ATPase
MKVVNLEVKGFRSLREITWRPGDLNVLIGPNGSGKTNLVLLLKLIAQSARGKLGDFVLRAGGIAPLLWDRKAEEFSFELVTTSDELSRDLAPCGSTYSLRIVSRGKEGFYQVQEEHLRRNPGTDPAGRRVEPMDFLARGARNGQVLESKGHWIKVDLDAPFTEETLLAACGGPVALLQRRKPGENLAAPYQKYVAGWSLYDPLPVDPDSKVREPVVARHATRVDDDGGNLINVLHTLYTGSRQFEKDLNAAMRAAFGDEFEELVFPPAADQRVQLRVRWKSLESEIPAADLSAGTLRFLFLVTVLAMPAPPPLIVIEEPEQSLHPAMLPIVAEHAVDAALRTQIVFTTHSPHFLDAFGDTRPTVTVFECQEGQTVLTTLEEERLDYWLKAYSLGKLFTSGVLEGER